MLGGAAYQRDDDDHAQKKISVPRVNAPGALSVTDGTIFIGRIVVQDGSYFAFSTDDSLLGEFATQSEAVRALPAAKVQS